MWEKTYGGDVRAWSATIRQTGGGECLLVTEGIDPVGGRSACALLRLSPTGDVIWAKLLADQSSLYVLSADVMETAPDGGAVVCGRLLPRLHSPAIGWFVKLGNTGAIDFQSTFANSLTSVVGDADGGYVFAGGSYTSGHGYDMTLTRLPLDGQYEGGCNRFGPGYFVAQDCAATSTTVVSVQTLTTVKGVATRLKASTPEARVKDICATR